MPVFSNLSIHRSSPPPLPLITPRSSTAPISPTSQVSTTLTSSLSSSTTPTLKSWKQFNEDNHSLNNELTKNHTSIDKEESRGVMKANKAATSPGKNTYPCQICDKVVKSKNCLNYHMKTHSGKQTFIYVSSAIIHAHQQELSNNTSKHIWEKNLTVARYVLSLSSNHHTLGSTGGHTQERRVKTDNYVLTQAVIPVISEHI